MSFLSKSVTGLGSAKAYGAAPTMSCPLDEAFWLRKKQKAPAALVRRPGPLG